MKVLEYGPDGTPRKVELTETEDVVADIHTRLVDRGYDQGTAVVILRGSDLPVRSDAPALDAVLADESFVLWLTQ